MVYRAWKKESEKNKINNLEISTDIIDVSRYYENFLRDTTNIAQSMYKKRTAYIKPKRIIMSFNNVK